MPHVNRHINHSILLLHLNHNVPHYISNTMQKVPKAGKPLHHTEIAHYQITISIYQEFQQLTKIKNPNNQTRKLNHPAFHNCMAIYTVLI